MNQRTFVQRRSAAWQRLEELLARASGKGVGQLDAEELFELGRLYRSLTSDLAYAQGHDFDAQLQAYLNRLTSRAHAYVYGSGVQNGWQRLCDFFVRGFPTEVRNSLVPIGICVALTVIWSVIAYASVQHDPSNADALLGGAPPHITKSLHDSNFGFDRNTSAEVSSFIITNNIRVAVIAFAAGIVSAGIFTVYIIVANALMLGALGALYAQAGFGMDFWATIAPHGVIELSAIQIAGGAGLLVAAGVLLPGRRTRAEAIAQSARRAGTLIAGVGAMLCVAGVIEGFFSPARFPMSARASVGGVTAIALLLYFSSAWLRTSTTDRAA